jgi:hypothetical protein
MGSSVYTGTLPLILLDCVRYPPEAAAEFAPVVWADE